MNGGDGWRKHRILWVAGAALLLLGAAYVGSGLRHLVFQKFPAVDLHMRWLEQRYVYNGQNPYDVVELVHAQKFNLPLPECTRDNRVDPAIGTPYHRAGGYPPWTFLTVAPIVLPTQWHFTATYFAILNVLALTITFVWAYQIGRPHSRAGGVFLALPQSPFSLTTGRSRLASTESLSMLCSLVFIGWCRNGGRFAGGILFGMATLKPQISALFALSFLVRRQWRALAAATAYVVLASVFSWVMTRTNPLEMLEQMYALAQQWTDHPNPRIKEQHPVGYSSFSSVLLDLHVDRKVATPLAAITGLLLAVALTWLWRNSSTLTLFAIAATTGRLWSYHLPYDDVMLIFLIVALGKLVMTHRSIGTVLAFCLVGLSLWAPIPYGHYPLPLQIAQMSSWLFGLAILLAWEPRSGQIEDQINLNETSFWSAAAPGSRAGIRSAAQRRRGL